jgi:hypothetical protein
MLIDRQLDAVTSGVKMPEQTSLLGSFFKSFGFDEPAKTSGGGGKSQTLADAGENAASNTGTGISGFFNKIASTVSDAVTAVVTAASPSSQDDDHCYLDDQTTDKHFEEEDDARQRCCFCIPTTPKDQVKYIACLHKISEYIKEECDDAEQYSDKCERCEHSVRAHKDFWKCMQRINQLEPLPFGAAAAEVHDRTQLELKFSASALGFRRYILRRRQLMNRKRCSLKKGLREGTCKLLLQPPEPDMDIPTLLMTLVRCVCSCTLRVQSVERVRRSEWRATCTCCTRKSRLFTATGPTIRTIRY